jgi:ABC-type transport system involved in cytochrome bd biosynthesis fused ATPase/permease subunit
MYLGSNCTEVSDDNSTNIFPTALRADLAGYLFRGRKSFSKTTLRNNEFLDRAENFELLDLLMNANLLPHGGGYMLPDINRVQKILEYKHQRYFACELIKDTNKLKIVRNVKELQFEYRGRDVILKTLQLELGEIIARLNPIFSLKL